MLLAIVVIVLLMVALVAACWIGLMILKANEEKTAEIDRLRNELRFQSEQSDAYYETLHEMYEAKLTQIRNKFKTELAEAHAVTEMLIHHYEGDKVS